MNKLSPGTFTVDLELEIRYEASGRKKPFYSSKLDQWFPAEFSIDKVQAILTVPFKNFWGGIETREVDIWDKLSELDQKMIIASITEEEERNE